MAESPENKNSENTLFMRLSAVFLTIRGNKKRKKSKKVLDKRKDIRYNTKALLVTMRLRETPVPIPNTTVKT